MSLKVFETRMLYWEAEVQALITATQISFHAVMAIMGKGEQIMGLPFLIVHIQVFLKLFKGKIKKKRF